MPTMRYTRGMQTVVLIVFALVVAAVAIDAIARLDERRPRKRPPKRRDENLISTQKIIVDLSKRR
jgi:hypothetical protein